MRIQHDLVIIGGGPAGLAAAISARENGVEDVLVLEREKELGGILNQCIHNGFGLHTFQEELTGPEYAARYIEKAKALSIPYRLSTTVVDLEPSGDGVLVTSVSREEGLVQIEAKAAVLAMGCRERPRGALNIPGTRPAGIFSAGTAQRLVNMEGYLPGKRVVILGSGDIGLIMARRMTLEGAKVKCVAELMPYSGGLKRNIVQCLDDYGIPLKLSHTVVDIQGKERVTGVTIAAVDEKLKPIPGTEEHFDCDTLLLSVGLIPENELSRQVGVQLSPVTNGPKVNESLETNLPGVFACGNVRPRPGGLCVRGGGAGRPQRRQVPAGGPQPGAEGNPPYSGRGGALHRALHPLPPAHGGGDRGALPGGPQPAGRPGAGHRGREGAAAAQAPGDGPRRDGAGQAEAGVVHRPGERDCGRSPGSKGGAVIWR